MSALPFVWHPPTAAQKKADFGDEPDLALLAYKTRQADSEFISALGRATLRNASRYLGIEPGSLPATATATRAWLRARFWKNGRFDPPGRPN